jgi:hypothetical protein
MDKINYALISALYDTKGADLYNDIYFPIIKYVIVNQYYTQIDVEKYYDLDDLQDLINENFGIIIPLIVLKQAIRAIDKGHNGVSLLIYEGGKQFKIRKAWDISVNTSIDNKSQELSVKFRQLEDLYQRFLEIEDLPNEKSFIDFYSDNTEEIFGYIENADGSSIIDERYVNITRFLEWIKNNNTELFKIANDIFWGSVIAGFLKRRTADINIRATDKVEYYLDSALVLAILDLDNQDNVNYAQELLEIIKSSGNIPKVHSLTVREISSILSSVERDQGPRANSAIEEAYHRRNLTPTKILQINNKLINLIENKGITVLPVSNSELDRIEVEYRNKKSVKELCEIRKSFAGNNNSIRDIHDIFLRDYIQKKRGNVANIEKINSYFVSLNTDLISFCNKDNSKRVSSIIIHPSKIVIDLWIHNSTSSLVKKNGLTEVMSRCFALNNTDIRRKLKVVSRYYNSTDSDYSDESYRAVYSALIKRSTRALKEVDAILLNEQENPANKQELNNNHIQVLIKIAVDEDVRKKQNTLSLMEEKKALTETMKLQEQSLISSEITKKEDKEHIGRLTRELESQKKINKITERINVISDDLSELEVKKNKSISNIKYWLILGLEVLFVLGFIFFFTFLICSYFKSDESIDFKQYISKNKIALIGTCLTALGFVSRIQKMYLFSPKVEFEKNKDGQIQYWIKRNPIYNTLKEELNDLQNERNTLNSILN